MTHRMLNIVLLVSVAACPVLARAQSPGSDRTIQAAPAEAAGITRAPASSWESWLNHGTRKVTPELQVPARSPELGKATAPSSPLIGPGSGLTGPESGRSPSRLRSNWEADLGGTAAERSRR